MAIVIPASHVGVAPDEVLVGEPIQGPDWRTATEAIHLIEAGHMRRLFSEEYGAGITTASTVFVALYSEVLLDIGPSVVALRLSIEGAHSVAAQQVEVRVTIGADVQTVSVGSARASATADLVLSAVGLRTALVEWRGTAAGTATLYHFSIFERSLVAAELPGA